MSPNRVRERNAGLQVTEVIWKSKFIMHLTTVQFLPDVYLGGGHSLLHTHAFRGGGLWGKSIFLGALSSTPAESAERASSTPHEKVRACRESEGRGPELVGLMQTQSTCVSKQKCVFAQQDMTLAADGVFLFIALAKYCLVCVCVCVRVLRVFLENLSSLHVHHLFRGILYQRG